MFLGAFELLLRIAFCSVPSPDKAKCFPLKPVLLLFRVIFLVLFCTGLCHSVVELATGAEREGGGDERGCETAPDQPGHNR